MAVFPETYISAQAGCGWETSTLNLSEVDSLHGDNTKQKPHSPKLPYSAVDITTDTWIKTKNQEEYLSKNPMRKHGHRRWGLPYSWEKLQLILDHSLTINLIRTAQHEQPCVHLFTEQKQKKHLEQRERGLFFWKPDGRTSCHRQCKKLPGCAVHVPQQGQAAKAELKAQQPHCHNCQW